MITDLQTKRVLALSQRQTFITVLPTRWRQKSTSIDMEQNYATVTLCISRFALCSSQVLNYHAARCTRFFLRRL